MPTKEYYKKHKEQLKENNKRWGNQHKEQLKKIKKRWADLHKKYFSIYGRKYFQEHKKELMAKLKETRHKLGISKKYLISRGGLSHTPEFRRLYRKCYKYRFRNAGELTIKTIQLVYEDNIKKYGTLTCEYCKNPIEFGKDTLDHKTPLSRNGTNDYENLCIACGRCNRRKNTKTVEEFKGGVF